jgi:hypothetical protein
MSKAKQLIEDLEYLESVGLTTDQLRRLHHWGGDPERETRVTFASARSYFSKDHDMNEKNAAFADRLRMITDLHRNGLSAMVELAIQTLPKL